MGNPTDKVASEISKPLSATAPEVNLSQVILMSGLSQEKAREAERLTQVGEGHISVRFSQKQQMHLPNYKPLKITSMFPLLFPTSVVLWRWAAILNGGEHCCANVNPKRFTKLSSLQAMFPITENTGHQSSSMELGFLFLTYKHHLISYF